MIAPVVPQISLASVANRTRSACTDGTCPHDFSKSLDNAADTQTAASKALNEMLAKELAKAMAGSGATFGAKPSFASDTWREMMVAEIAKSLNLKVV
jgi:hypothetical protein